MPFDPNRYYQTPNADPGYGQAAATLASVFAPDPAAQARLQAMLIESKLNGEKITDTQNRRTYMNASADKYGQGDVQGAMAEAFRSGDADLIKNLPGFTTGFYASGDPAGVDQQRLSNMVVGSGGQYQDSQLGQEFLETGTNSRNAADNSRALQQTGMTAAASRYGHDQDLAGARYTADQRLVGDLALPGLKAAAEAKSPSPPSTIEAALVRMANPDGSIALPGGQTTDLGSLFNTKEANAQRAPKDPLQQAVARDKLAGSASSLLDAATADFPLDPAVRAQIIDAAVRAVESGQAASIEQAIAAQGSLQQTGNWGTAPNQTVLQPPALPPIQTPGPKPGATMTAQPGVQLPADIPPPAQREVGKVYQTPKGPMIWQGAGWTPAGA